MTSPKTSFIEEKLDILSRDLNELRKDFNQRFVSIEMQVKAITVVLISSIVLTGLLLFVM